MAELARFLALGTVACALTVSAVAFVVRGVLGTDLAAAGRWVHARERAPETRSVRRSAEEVAMTEAADEGRRGRVAPAPDLAVASARGFEGR